MDLKKVLILGILLVLVVVLGFIFFHSTGEEKIESNPIPPPQISEGIDEEAQETRTVKLFFLSDRGSLLYSEEREIFVSSSVVDQAKQAIKELIAGPQNDLISPFPPETKLRELFITPQGIAYIDFSGEVQERHPSGASAEIATVYSVVNSLTYNFKPIKSVFILIDGGEQETLGGHIDLSRPLRPRYDLIAR